MTLITGIRGINKSYIAADSRATITNSDGTVTYSDGARKWMNHGPKSMTAAAGDAQLAAYVTQKILDKLGDNPTYLQVKSVFANDLKPIAEQFNRETGRYCACTIMLAGYNPEEKDSFDAGRIGEIMRAGVKAQGEGVMFNQSIHKEITKSLTYALTMAEILRKPIGLGDSVPVNLPKSELAGYSIRVEQTGVKIGVEEAGQFEALFYGADSAFNKIELPDEVIADIYFRDVDGHATEDILKYDTIKVFSFINGVVEDRGYTNVGGGIFPILITEGGNSFYGGSITRLSLSTGATSQVRVSEVINNRLSYKDQNGEWVEYESLLDIALSINTDYSVYL